jgi:hypothetical protein
MPELKVTTDHLKRDAYLYVRQSTLRQVAEHGESTQRQYALRDRAIAAGWPIERIHVIDRDLGKSGSSTTMRDGFQQLVSEVALGKAGIVMGLEVSRLARNSADWHRLIELCALTATLIRPYGDGGEHEARNGLLLRRDIHSLFDAGYVTVTPDLRFEVSRRIKEEFDNGRHYYELHGNPIFAPAEAVRRPDPEALRWHNEHAYRG